MTFEYTDPTGERLYFRPAVVNAHQPTEAVALETETGRPVYFAADQLEDVIAGMRDIRRQAARTASGQQPETAVAYGDGKGRIYCQHCAHTAEAADVPLTVDHVDHWELCPNCGRHVIDVAREAPTTGKPDPAIVDEFISDMATQPDPTTADDPTPLRWGHGDVLHGDDDTVTVCLSGPDREPYWLELDAERAAALRDDLAAPAVGQPAEAQAADEALLTAAERQFLTFALDLADNRMANRSDEFTTEDYQALAAFRRMAEEARS